MAKKSNKRVDSKVVLLVFLVLLALGIVFSVVGPQQALDDPELAMGLYYAGVCMSVLFGLLFGYTFMMVLAGNKPF